MSGFYPLNLLDELCTAYPYTQDQALDLELEFAYTTIFFLRKKANIGNKAQEIAINRQRTKY